MPRGEIRPGSRFRVDKLFPFDRASRSGYNGSKIASGEIPLPQNPNAKESIDEPTFEHLVELAALELSGDEKQYLRQELNQQMRSIRELEAIEIEPGVPITSHGVPYTPLISAGLRQDQDQPCPEADDILAQGPEVHERYFVVPDIPHEELE
jgi:aspartyl/glutamyl-tRNA(Asn/Gln) amidotransferase C subunit